MKTIYTNKEKNVKCLYFHTMREYNKEDKPFFIFIINGISYQLNDTHSYTLPFNYVLEQNLRYNLLPKEYNTLESKIYKALGLDHDQK